MEEKRQIIEAALAEAVGPMEANKPAKTVKRPTKKGSKAAKNLPKVEDVVIVDGNAKDDKAEDNTKDTNVNNKPAKNDKADSKEQPRKVGRPRKNANIVPIAVQGIRKDPRNADDVVEMVYYKPVLFQKIISLLKQYKVTEVALDFREDGIVIHTNDVTDNNNIKIKVDGRCVNFYYCKEPRVIWVKCSDLEMVHSGMPKNYGYKITWLLKENPKNILYVITKESEYESDEINEIELFEKDENAVVGDFNDKDYPIKFKLSSTHFKKKIEDGYKLGDKTSIVLEKNGLDPLQLSYDNSNKKPKSTRTIVYNDSDRISLQSKLTADDIFRVAFSAAYVIPFVKVSLGDCVYISADSEKRVSFKSFADKCENGWTASVQIYTSIIGYRT